jgi:hypothetical protein
MKKSMKSIMLSAAVGGMLGLPAVALQAATPNSAPNTVSANGQSLGQTAFTGLSAKDKHACKGQNSCKCKSSDNGCKGKNSCKGKGGCATDGSKMPH